MRLKKVINCLIGYSSRILKIKLIIFIALAYFFTGFSFSKDDKNPPKKENDNIKSSVITNSTDKTDKKNDKNEMGVYPIILENTISNLEKDFKKLDSKFIGFKSNLEDHYFQKLPKLLGKKIDTSLVKIVGDKIYYNKSIEFLLISNPSEIKKIDTIHYYPKILQFSTDKISNKIKSIHLKFYDTHLYEFIITFELNINEMNELVDQYHKNFGENSEYNITTESYLWKKNNYNVTLNTRGNSFPRKIQVLYSHTIKLEANWQYFDEVKKLIDKTLSQNK
ncbi:MAG: hypothetical protein OEV44_10075 [Spirochaetota bacterium]|nr:hypothetical protein [Spirochaetota bacterium]